MDEEEVSTTPGRFRSLEHNHQHSATVTCLIPRLSNARHGKNEAKRARSQYSISSELYTCSVGEIRRDESCAHVTASPPSCVPSQKSSQFRTLTLPLMPSSARGPAINRGRASSLAYEAVKARHSPLISCPPPSFLSRREPH